MIISNKEFQRKVQRYFSPGVLVLTTDDVKKSCRKNNLDFVDLLRPYENICSTIYTSLRRETGTIVVRDFQVRFYGSVEDFKPKSNQNLREYFKIFRQNEDSQDNPEISSIANEFLENTFQMCRYNTFHHIRGLMLVASANENNPPQILKKMYDEKQYISFFKEYNIDPYNISTFYVLLHDQESFQGTKENLRNIHMKMHQMFGPSNTKLVSINSRVIEEEKRVNLEGWNRKSPLFHQFKSRRKESCLLNNNIHGSVLGEYLSQNDLLSISNMVEEFIKNGLIQYWRGSASYLSPIRYYRRTAGILAGRFFAKKVERKIYDTSDYRKRKYADNAFILQSYREAFLCYRDIRSPIRKLGEGYETSISEMMAFSSFMEKIQKDEDVKLVDRQELERIEKGLRASILAYNRMNDLYSLIRATLFLGYFLMYEKREEESEHCFQKVLVHLKMDYPDVEERSQFLKDEFVKIFFCEKVSKSRYCISLKFGDEKSFFVYKSLVWM